MLWPREAGVQVDELLGIAAGLFVHGGVSPCLLNKVLRAGSYGIGSNSIPRPPSKSRKRMA
jgi:hypothetical protein